MDLALLVYGISVLSLLGVVLTFVILIALIVLIGSGLGYLSEYGDAVKTASKWLKATTIVLTIVVPIRILVPSEQTMYTMVGAYAAQKVAKDPKVQQLSAKVLKLVENKLDSYISESVKKVAK